MAQLDNKAEVEVYAVGVLYDLLRLGRAVRARHPKAIRHVLKDIRWRVGHVHRQAKSSKWRAVRQHFNGYLAEPARGPRCGRGWTKKRALRDLERLQRESDR